MAIEKSSAKYGLKGVASSEHRSRKPQLCICCFVNSLSLSFSLSHSPVFICFLSPFSVYFSLSLSPSLSLSLSLSLSCPMSISFLLSLFLLSLRSLPVVFISLQIHFLQHRHATWSFRTAIAQAYCAFGIRRHRTVNWSLDNYNR